MKHRQLLYGQPLPQDFLDALQEFVGVMASRNLTLTLVAGSANQIQIVAGSGSAQVSIGIDGLWRYISATTTTTVTGAAGTYDIFVTCNNNSFSTNPSPPPPELDATDYTFALATPLIQGNVPGTPHYRKVGEVIFDGTRITSLRQTLGDDGAQLAQPGDLKTSAAANPPAGWLLCQGQAVSRTTYAALYAALGGSGSPWGAGDGSTTFNVPDFRSRVLIGAGQGGGLTSRPLGQYGGGTLDPNPAGSKLGEEAHTLLVGEIPGHTHAQGAHTHGFNVNSGTESAFHTHNETVNASNVSVTQSGPNGAAVVGGTPGITGTENQTHYHNVAGSTDGGTGGTTGTGTGGGGTHNSMQPYAAVNVFIKF